MCGCNSECQCVPEQETETYYCSKQETDCNGDKYQVIVQNLLAEKSLLKKSLCETEKYYQTQISQIKEVALAETQKILKMQLAEQEDQF